MTNNCTEPILKVRNLKKYFPIKSDFLGRPKTFVKAVDGISFEVNAGETIGIVGESGCGKSTAGRTILRLIDATEGEVLYHGENIFNYNRNEMIKMRTKLQIVFQDPFSSLNPRMTAGKIIGDAVLEHNLSSKADIDNKVKKIAIDCGLEEFQLNRYPHEFSGGQRQRIGIARALALNPEFIVCDEPVSALDVSVQAQIVNLLESLQEAYDLTYMFITHDISVVKHISTKIGVMYLGTLVELAGNREFFKNSLHPYSRALLSAVPIPDPTIKKERIILQGDMPSPSSPPPGCKFHTRCPNMKSMCAEVVPELKDVGGGHMVACHLV